MEAVMLIVSIALALTAVMALAWAVRHRQFDELDDGAAQIFDDLPGMERG